MHPRVLFVLWKTFDINSLQIQRNFLVCVYQDILIMAAVNHANVLTFYNIIYLECHA